MKHCNIDKLPVSHKSEHEAYEYLRRKFLSYGETKHSVVSIYEIPPGKSAYPYHYHHKNEETFYIISGEGILKSVEGEKRVAAGDLLFFPTGPEGAHKLTNCSDTENLVYLDFDAVHDIDVTIYPDSDKLGVWGMGINKLYPENSNVNYYDGE